ncbi:TonB dependent receptor [Lentimicrobium saccharophilum]|uniref:TonB dependent receptor n=1 Tax=Lentimicrobium saccharophilum TaxID=1678841 RepID=A0A0S7BS80_9BACT|nr:TonB-dependent receptor [Lentimicrobium saccharophilum]GAP43500.1 TonB dependent receptor [Lentimicrobium saccharophilum]
MIRNLLLTIGLVLATSALVFSQSGTLRGKVIDKTTKEPIPFVNIIVELGGTQAGGTTSDFDGNYTIKPITPGRYNLKATFVGFKPVMITGLIIKSDQITFQNVEMESTMIEIETFEIVEYAVPLIDKDKTSVGATVTSEEIAKMPNRSANAIATTVGGVFSADGERGSVRGQRSEGTVMYIDGIRVRGSSSLPESAIEQVSVILSGVPAQYGDATGGIINVTTKGPSREFGAGIELQTSQYLDAFGYNRAGLNMQGPLLWNKDKTSSLLGYFVAGEVVYNQDSRPTATGIYKVKDDVLRQLEATPLRLSGTGFGTYYNTNFVRQSDLEFVKATPNTANIDINASGKIDVKTGPNINLSLGGSINFSDGRNFNYAQSMFNYDKNIQVIDNTWRVFARFTQRFPADKESKSLIKNVFYTIQADYTKYDQTVQDADHKDQLFNYGYLGKYETNKIRSYEFGFDTITQKTAFIHNGFQDIAVDFTPGTANPIISNYTRQYYELYPEDFYHNNLNNIISGGGLLNGMTAPAIYGLWGSPGASQAVVGNQAGYQRIDNEQYAINANASADIGNHALQFGFIYEQRVDRYYNYTPIGLWSLMRGLTNAHIEQLDVTNPKLVYLDGVFMDTIYYDRKYDALSQRYFDKSLRSSIGLPADGTDWIDIDSYDVNALTINYYDANGKRHTASLANALSIDMFSPDELLNNGENLASYSGYTYTGERVKLKDSPSFDDFFTKRDADGNFTREIAPFSPIYMAGFIQDKFAFDDLIFNIGVRVDRFDANQQVLTDPYTIYPALTVNEVNDLGQHPQNMGNDYVVYVDNMRNPTTIMGYRNGDTWYNADGLVVTDPSISLDAGNGVTPYLADRNNVTVSSKAFSDYEPQISVMPRISFSFPISDEALFFAHYDVLTQRPTYALRMNPLDYFFLPVLGSPTINNPNLKPEKTIDYELGFQQRLTNSSSLTLSAYYREIRDQIQAYRYTAAYPKTYYSYNNIDFSTVKGLTVTYDLRRTSNARVRASYTLQFANGTGSDPEFAKGLIQTGQPNLRTLFPLSFDRRHALNLMLDYRFAEGKEYNGPVIRRKKTDAAGAEVVKTTQLLKNTGVNFTIFGGSGTPYTKSSKIVQLGQSGIIDGSVNGSRLPWQFRIDGRVDKDINVSWGEGKRQSYLNVYLQVLNILDSKNIMSVYAATGNPDDDGYLAAAEYQTQINSQLDPDAYRELYSLRINSPGNYSSPRQIRLGLIFNF